MTEDAPKIVWSDPPPSERGSSKSKWDQVASELRKNPGRWALIAAKTTSGNGLSTMIRKGEGRVFSPPGAFEATTRAAGKTDDGKRLVDVYARFIGESADSTNKTP